MTLGRASFSTAAHHSATPVASPSKTHVYRPEHWSCYHLVQRCNQNMLLSSKTNHQGFLQVLYQMDQTKHLETRQKGTELSWRARGLHRRASFKDPAVFERLFEVTPRSSDERRVIGSLISGSRWGASLNRLELAIQASTRHEATRTVVFFFCLFFSTRPTTQAGQLARLCESE